MNKFYGDYHIHTNFSHGKNTVLQNAVRAKELGFKEIAICDHGFSHIAFGLRRINIDLLKKQIEEAKLVTGINIMFGIESNLISLNGDIDARESDGFEIILCNFHKFAFPKNISSFFNLAVPVNFESLFNIRQSQKRIAKNTDALVKAIEKNKIAVIPHINFVMSVDCLEVAKACAHFGTMIELSGKKSSFSDKQFYDMQAANAKFIFNSDSHTIANVGNFDRAISFLQDMNLGLEVAENYGKRPVFRT